jgi:hypothetical protein
MTIEGPPEATEVYGPRGLLGVAPGKVQMVRGEEEVIITLRANGYETKTVEVVPSQDRSISIDLPRKKVTRPAKRTETSGKSRRPSRDTIEDPFGN